jgi:hypothetical protein
VKDFELFRRKGLSVDVSHYQYQNLLCYSLFQTIQMKTGDGVSEKILEKVSMLGHLICCPIL